MPARGRPRGGLDAKDFKILELKRTDPKLTLEEIGKRIGMTKQSVSERMKKKSFKDTWEALDRSVLLQLQELQHDGALVLKGILAGSDDLSKIVNRILDKVSKAKEGKIDIPIDLLKTIISAKNLQLRAALQVLKPGIDSEHLQPDPPVVDDLKIIDSNGNPVA